MRVFSRELKAFDLDSFKALKKSVKFVIEEVVKVRHEPCCALQKERLSSYLNSYIWFECIPAGLIYAEWVSDWVSVQGLNILLTPPSVLKFQLYVLC